MNFDLLVMDLARNRHVEGSGRGYGGASGGSRGRKVRVKESWWYVEAQ